MNILIPHSWIKEHLDTQATPAQIAEFLSLCCQSVEKVHQIDKDSIFEIEVTTNRPDCLSLYGITRELAAILPRFRINAKLIPLPETRQIFPEISKSLPLKIEIQKPSLCPRFTALIFEGIKISPSPRIVQDRLKKVGIRALSNVVDISNYLMIELGQPMHTFDYDKILKAKMVLREAKEEESLTTLDGQKRNLPEGAIVIEDGERRLIDLCGIMGGLNSEVDDKTTRVLLFVQTYDPIRIRQTCQSLAFRTTAASYFEKGVDAEGVIPAMKKAMVMFEKYCHAKVASQLIDLYPHPAKPYQVTLSRHKLNKTIGISITLPEARNILNSLQIPTKIIRNTLVSQIPHWRYGDLLIEEDLIEEVARIYGYHLLPSILPSGEIPLETSLKNQFFFEDKTKDLLKGMGFHEAVTYSLVSQKILSESEPSSQNLLEIENPLSVEWAYLRPVLVPSLLSTVSLNYHLSDLVKMFEVANTYHWREKQTLPRETMTLAAVWAEKANEKDQSHLFSKLKGSLEVLLKELNIKQVSYSLLDKRISPYWSPEFSIFIKVKTQTIGTIGLIHPKTLASQGIKIPVTAFELNLDTLLQAIDLSKQYQPISSYPATIEDFSLVVPAKTFTSSIIETIYQVDPVILRVELKDVFDNVQTYRVTYQSDHKTLASDEVEKVRRKIIAAVNQRFGATLKGFF